VLGSRPDCYACSLEPLRDPIAVSGIGKSAVNERFVIATARKLSELMRRKLMPDGVRFAEIADYYFCECFAEHRLDAGALTKLRFLRPFARKLRRIC
jgi:hypothetical protein